MDHILKTEQWRPVVGYEGIYMVSNLGRVKTLGASGKPACIRKLRHDKDGYLVVSLWNERKACLKKVHRLVLESFVGPCPDGMQTRHFPDNDRSNNKLENLSWATAGENSSDKRDHGTVFHPSGTKNGASKISEDDVLRIFAKHNDGTPQRIISSEVGICIRHLREILKGKYWAHVKREASL